VGFFLDEAFRNGKVRISGNRKIYLKKICKLSKIQVWLVDGEYIRRNICEDFVNYAHYFNFKFIPKNEFWIADGTKEDEIIYYIDHMLVEHRLMLKGMSFEEASAKASLAEKRERGKSEIMKKLGSVREHKKEIIGMIHKKLLKKYSDKVRVWIVDGELVRDVFYTFFGGGGHDKVFHFIPDNEIWIDQDIHPGERKFILIHELHERSLMAKGKDYHHSHRKATEIEDFFRHHPKGLDKTIKEEIGRQAR
jgi:hypothetical protein